MNEAPDRPARCWAPRTRRWDPDSEDRYDGDVDRLEQRFNSGSRRSGTWQLNSTPPTAPGNARNTDASGNWQSRSMPLTDASYDHEHDSTLSAARSVPPHETGLPRPSRHTADISPRASVVDRRRSSPCPCDCRACTIRTLNRPHGQNWCRGQCRPVRCGPSAAHARIASPCSPKRRSATTSRHRVVTREVTLTETF